MGSNQEFARTVVASNFREHSPFCPLRSFCRWVGPVVRPNVCPQPTAGTTVEPVLVALFLYLGYESLWSDFGLFWGCLQLPCLWCHFRWTPAEGMLDGAGPQEKTVVESMVFARFALVYSERGSVATLENCPIWFGGSKSTGKRGVETCC